jgi:cytochrome b561
MWQAAAAKTSHVLLYTLLIVMPLVSWSMPLHRSYPIVPHVPLHLRLIATHDDTLPAILPTHGSPTCSSRKGYRPNVPSARPAR